MDIKILIEENNGRYTYCNGLKEDDWCEQKIVKVDVPLLEICKIIARDYDVSPETLRDIFCDFEVGLDYEVAHNQAIQDLAYDIYWRNLCGVD